MSGPKRPSTKEVYLEGLKKDGSRFEYFVFKYRVWLAFAFFFAAVALGLMLRPRISHEGWQPSGVQKAHALGLALYSYAQDNGGNYPTGKTSTEIFQKLVDGGYVTDPALFYLPMSGKTRGTDKMLKPENVCWDVTAGTRANDSSNVPLLYSTGCKVDYTPGAKVRVSDGSPFGSDGMVVYYVNNSSMFANAKDGEVQLLRPDYNPKDRKYVQLPP